MTAFRSAACALILAGAAAASVAAPGEWRHQYYTTARNHPNRAARPIESVASWVNGVCRPDRMSDVTGLVSQRDEAGTDYNIHVFCRTGRGKVTVAPTSETWSAKGGPELVKTLAGRSVVILGLYRGDKQDTVFILEQVGAEAAAEED